MSTAELFDHQASLANIPAEPGVYIMKDRAEKIVYVGKAKSLKARVRSYFAGGDPRPFVHHLPAVLSAIDVLITRNEKEAVILENTLIKKHQPRFNFMLKDDKEFLRLRIDPNEHWPWVRIVRRERSDGARYFGPYHSASACRAALRVLNRHFMLRTCRDSVLNNRSRPCLQYQIKRCPAPCVLEVNRDDYLDNVKAAMLFLGGRRSELLGELTERMQAAARALEFEHAATIRDQVRAVEKVLERQQAVQTGEVDQDIFALFRTRPEDAARDSVAVQLLYVRGGRLQGGDVFHFEDALGTDAEVLSQMIMRHYASGAFIPGEVVVQTQVDSQEALAEILTETRGAKVKITVPQRGTKRELVLTGIRNAEQQLAQQQAENRATESTLVHCVELLDLERVPRRIECFDISNLQGSAIVASMVVFVDGAPAKSHYRTYKIRDIEGQDDFASMYEVVTRRYRGLAEAEDDDAAKAPVVPDLVVIDGGKGQLGAALQALEDLGVDGAFDLISLAKARASRDSFDPEVVHSPERVFKPGRAAPIVPPQDSDVIRLLAHIRDEAHRVAIGFHRKVRDKGSLRSKLDAIPGIGPRRKAALLRHFGSVDRIRTATLEELCGVRGMTRPAAETVHEHLNAIR